MLALHQVSPSTPTAVRERRSRRDTETMVKLATKREEVFACLRLVYNSYLETGLVRPNPNEIRILSQHLLPTTEIFAAKRGGQVVCTMTLVRDGEEGLPMEDVYHQEVADRRQYGNVAEVSCLADEQDGKERSLTTLFQTMSLMAQCAKQRGVNELLITVHPHHAGFYRRFIGFEQFGELKTYESVQNRPAVALKLDLDRFHIDHPRAYKRFFGTPFSEEQLAPRFLADSIRYEMSRILRANAYAASRRAPRRQAASITAVRPVVAFA